MTAELNPGNGITTGYKGNNFIILQSLTAFSAIAWYNCIELIVLIFLIFKKYEGVYFWALVLTTLSIIPYQFGAWVKQVQTTYTVPDLLPVAFLNISWMIMIPGQSLVLWSRLHLICHNYKLLRFILWLIIIDAFVFMIPTTVLTWGTNTRSGPFLTGYSIMEKIQMVAFTLQEVFISSVYLWQIRKVLQIAYEGSARKIMWELLAVNVLIIVMDIALLVVEFNNLYQIETTLKGMIYSVKLKLEFGVLSKLVKVVVNRKAVQARLESSGHTPLHLEEVESRGESSHSDAKSHVQWGRLSGSTDDYQRSLSNSDYPLSPGQVPAAKDWPRRKISDLDGTTLMNDRRPTLRPDMPHRLSVTSLGSTASPLSYPGRATV